MDWFLYDRDLRHERAIAHQNLPVSLFFARTFIKLGILAPGWSGKVYIIGTRRGQEQLNFIKNFLDENTLKDDQVTLI